MSEIKQLISLMDEIVSNFDPTPVLQSDIFPLRWEAEISIFDYDFDQNILELDIKFEGKNGVSLVSVKSAIEIIKHEDGNYKFYDGAYWAESHSWISKLNDNEDYPSLSLLNENFNTFEDLVSFIKETYL
jgi:hypothetical protein